MNAALTGHGWRGALHAAAVVAADLFAVAVGVHVTLA